MDLANCLFEWLQTFKLKGSCSQLRDLTDGVAISSALIEIDPQHFGNLLKDRIETKCNDHWMKLSNLRRIDDSIDDFILEETNRKIPDKFKPNLEAIAKDANVEQLALLLQLVLHCSINCSSKEKHIEVMKQLSHDVKHSLMIAIDEFVNSDENSGEEINALERNESPMKANYSSDEFQKLKDALRNMTSARDKATESLLEMDGVVQQMAEDKKAMKLEIEKLNEKLKNSQFQSTNTAESAMRFDSIEHENLFTRLNNQIVALQSDLSKTEEQRDDFRMQLQIKDQEYHKVVLNLEQAQSKLNDFKYERDELDELRYLKEKVVRYQDINEAQKKRLEEFVELKKQMKSLEERNAGLIKQNCQLEEENKQLAIFKGQIEHLKKQREDLRTKACEESFRADKSEDELKRLHKKFSETLSEKEKIQLDLERFRQQEALSGESLDVEFKQQQNSDNTLQSALSQDFRSSELQEKLIRIEFENDQLKKELKSSNDERVKLLESQLEDEHSRVLNYENESRSNKQKIIELEGLLSDYQSHGSNGKSDERSVALDPESKLFRTKVKQLESENASLKQTIEKCNLELQEKEQRNQKLLEKAKETYGILQNHSKMASSQSNSLSGADSVKHSDELCYWKNMNAKKDEELKKTNEALAFYELEKRLMSVSFHNLSLNLQRHSAESRLQPENYAPSSTFLQQQRQTSSQNLMIPRT